MNWQPEEIVSDWNNPRAAFPALAMHRTGPDTVFTIVYQQVVDTMTGKRGILWASKGRIGRECPHCFERFYPSATGRYVTYRVDTGGTATTESTPAIAAVDAAGVPNNSADVIAWGSAEGVRVATIPIQKPYNHFEQKLYAKWTAMNPTLWAGDSTATEIDTLISPGKNGLTDTIPYAVSRTPFWIAWQQYDFDSSHKRPYGDSVWEVYAQKLQLYQKDLTPYPYPEIDTLLGEAPHKVSFEAWPQSYNNKRPCISGINSADSCVVMIAYESNESMPDAQKGLGVTVARHRFPTLLPSWQRSTHYDPYDSNEAYTKPSIAVTKYHDQSGTWTATDFYYSLAFEWDDKYGSNSVLHYAQDDATPRVTAQLYLNLRDPQLSVAVQGRDSVIERVCLSTGGEPRWVIHQSDGLFKAVDHSSIHEYRSILERDSSGNVRMNYGFGELTLDDGTTSSPLDLISRPDSVAFDSAHPAAWFMRTENFRIPTTGTIGYISWIHLSQDSLYRSFQYDTVKYVLELRDSAGDARLLSVDSLLLHDTITKYDPASRTVDFRIDSSRIGYLLFTRLTGNVRTDSSRIQDVLTPITLSDAFKKSSRTSVKASGAFLLVRPNPFRSYVDVDFELPERGIVSIEVRDALGRLVDQLPERQYSSGRHSASWSPGAEESAGIYTFVLRYGNEVKAGKAVLTK